MHSSGSARMEWYIEHRLEYLRNRRDKLKSTVSTFSAETMDFEMIRELVELTGRIRELEQLLLHAESW